VSGSDPVYIIPGEQAAENPIDLVGGKGKNLGRLLKLYPHVPPFFVISASAYRDIADQIGLDKIISSIERNLQENKSIDNLSQNIRALWLDTKFPPRFRSQVWDACQEIRQGKTCRLAIRSSASLEDQPGSSFAGQLESFLNIRTPTQLWKSIRHCWASIWRPAAIHYQYRRNLSFKEIGVAVIIQRFIPASASGVLFTVNPVSGAGDEFMIEANWGLGPSLVQGEITPDNYLVGRQQLNVIQQTIGSKKVAIRSSPGGKEGIEHTNLSRAKQNQAVLSANQASQLAQIGLRVTQKQEAPQDLEWALYRNKFYLLQCRPVTAVGVKPDKTPETRQEWWTNYFFAERFPQPVSPLSWSILAKYLERRAFLEPLAYLGIGEFKEGRILKLISGRPYTNLRTFQLLYQSFPSFLLPEDKRNLLTPQAGKQLPSGDLFSAIVKIVARENHWRIRRHKQEWERFVKRYSAYLKKLEDIDLNQLSWKRLFTLVDRLEGFTDKYLSIHRWSITYADIFYHLLKLFCRKMMGDKDNQLATSLITGLEGNLTVEINSALWQISRHLKRKVSEKELKGFMKRYGHCSNNLDLSCPRWRENPKYALNLIRYLSRLDDDQSPSAKEEELHRLRVKNTCRVKDLLSASTPAFLPSFSAYLFSKLLDLTQYFVILRENQRFYWQMSLSQLRLVLLALATKLKKKKS
jgi:pyruvate,water dikinase